MTRPKMTAPSAAPRSAPGRVSEVTCDTFIGIDPGLDGAFAVVSVNELLPAYPFVTPTVKDARGKRSIDREKAFAMLSPFKTAFIAIEKVNAAPMRGRVQGTTSMFNFGRDFGVWLGIITALGRPYVEVDPRKWKRAILGGTKKDKAAAIAYARTLYPTVDLKASPRCRTFHDGKADAICIAEYARQVWKIQQLTGATK